MSRDRREEERARAGAAVEARRREVEDRLGALRAAMASETGFAPRRKGVLAALIAATVGLAIALRRRAKREDETGDPDPSRSSGA